MNTNPQTPRKLTLLTSALLLSGLSIANAAASAYDGFVTPASFTSISNTNGGSGFPGAYGSSGVFSFIRAPGGLSYGSLETLEGQASTPINSGEGGIYAFTQNTRALTLINSGDFWISWLYKPSATVYGGLGVSRASGGELFYIGSDGGNSFRMDLTNAGGGNNTYGSFNGGTYLIAVNVNFSSGNTNVYVNPTSLGAAAPATPTVSVNTDLIGVGLNQIVFLAGADGQTSFDEIRLGNSFSDVTPVPEPTTWIGASLVFGLAVYSQRKKLAGLIA